MPISRVRALDDAYRQHAGDAEGHRDPDKHTDHLSGHALRTEGVEQLTVGFHPALRAQSGQAGQPFGDAIGFEYFADRGIDHGDASGQVEKGLSLLQVEVDIARIQLTHP